MLLSSSVISFSYFKSNSSSFNFLFKFNPSKYPKLSITLIISYEVIFVVSNGDLS